MFNIDMPKFKQSRSNRHFDDYQAEELERLKAERTQFGEFLEERESLKEQREFNSFMRGRQE